MSGQDNIKTTPIGTLGKNALIQRLTQDFETRDKSTVKGLDNDASATAIKEIIKEMIDGEDKTKPLTDDRLCAALQERGYDIKRRTVAKYRESMRIPVARQRKTL